MAMGREGLWLRPTTLGTVVVRRRRVRGLARAGRACKPRTTGRLTAPVEGAVGARVWHVGLEEERKVVTAGTVGNWDDLRSVNNGSSDPGWIVQLLGWIKAVTQCPQFTDPSPKLLEAETKWPKLTSFPIIYITPPAGRSR